MPCEAGSLGWPRAACTVVAGKSVSASVAIRPLVGIASLFVTCAVRRVDVRGGRYQLATECFELASGRE